MPTQSEILKALARLVREGRAEYTLVDGKPALRLINRNPDVAKSEIETKETPK